MERNCPPSLLSVVHSAMSVCSVSSYPCTKYLFLGSGVQNSNPKVKKNVVVPCRVNKTDDEVSLLPTSGENFDR